LNDDRLNIRVGLVMLGALAVAAVAVLALSGRPLARVHEYHADFARIAGLKAGAKVRLSGRDVGEVRDVRFAARGLLRVDFWVRRAYRRYLHQNSEVYIGLGGAVLGEPTLEIGPPRGAPPGPELPVDAVVRGLDPPQLDDVLARLYEHLSALAAQLGEQQSFIDELLRALDRLVATASGIPADPQLLVRIQHNAQVGLLEALDLISALRRGTDDGVGLRRSADQLTRLWRTVAADLERLRPRLDRALAGSERLRQVLAPGERERLRVALGALGRAAEVGSAVAGEIGALADRVRSGRGTIGAFLTDQELVDDIKQMNRVLKDTPWVTLAKPTRPRRE
jgi:phospholipid/cholesterol/gamma-HCH transport system substrate-binding protein